MKISDLFKMGLKNLARRKARTILTVLGVVIGSLSIIIMRSIGYGMENNFQSQLMQQGGLTTITVNTFGAVFDENGNYVDSKQQKLDDNLVNQLKQIEHVKAVSPWIEKSVSLYAGKYVSYASIVAIDLDTFEAFDFPELQYGSYPTEEDRTPIVFGYNSPWGFFDPYSRGMRRDNVEVDLQKDKIVMKFNDYPVDQRRNKKEFSLTLKNIAKMEETRGDYDYSTYMDIDYFKQIYRQYCNTLSLEDRKRAMRSIDEYQSIKLNVDNVDNVTEVQDKIEELGFQSWSMMTYLEPLQKTSRTLQMVLGALGAVAMVVSAISIANTMVMSIYERTKEIGIMKVLGCVVTDIRKLFLLEAAIIGMFGGFIGIVLGYISSWVINKFGGPIFGSLMSTSYMYDMNNTTFSIIPIYLPFLAMGISICVGLCSGYFPARRATKISAIEAMKTEG
jgi:ABC-type antimicrobial peptide transport system permease subunit